MRLEFARWPTYPSSCTRLGTSLLMRSFLLLSLATWSLALNFKVLRIYVGILAVILLALNWGHSTRALPSKQRILRLLLLILRIARVRDRELRPKPTERVLLLACAHLIYKLVHWIVWLLDEGHWLIASHRDEAWAKLAILRDALYFWLISRLGTTGVICNNNLTFALNAANMAADVELLRLLHLIFLLIVTKLISILLSGRWLLGRLSTLEDDCMHAIYWSSVLRRSRKEFLTTDCACDDIADEWISLWQVSCEVHLLPKR